jgi:hypothetical protein
MLTGGVVLPFVLAVFAAFLYCAYRDVFGHRDKNTAETTTIADNTMVHLPHTVRLVTSRTSPLTR